MKDEAIRALLLDALGDVAPECDASPLAPAEPIRDQLEIDSMDFLNFVIAVHRRSGVEIPEIDYPKLATLDSAVRYLAARIGSGAAQDRQPTQTKEMS